MKKIKIGYLYSIKKNIDIADKLVIIKDLYDNPIIEEVDENNKSIYDIIFIFGGDGFMLAAMHKLLNNTSPLYGINCGNIGFLMNNDFISYENFINNKYKKYIIKPLSVTFFDNSNTKIASKVAFNEFVMIRKEYRTINMKVKINDISKIIEINGDGLIAATAIGSHAYNKSASGILLPLHSDHTVMTLLNPYKYNIKNKSILLNSEDEIEIFYNNQEADTRPMQIYIDHCSIDIDEISKIKITLSSNIFSKLLYNIDNDLKFKILQSQIN
ncbi:MAG: hypothetical protein OEY79_04720 [Anaplasmataceae bacterium]|nr:hypothetical protein [Anaplasmataceae bacterium]